MSYCNHGHITVRIELSYVPAARQMCTVLLVVAKFPGSGFSRAVWHISSYGLRVCTSVTRAHAGHSIAHNHVPDPVGGRPIEDLQGMRDAAVALHALGPALVLVKGGHMVGPAGTGAAAVDVAYDGRRLEEFSTEAIRWALRSQHDTTLRSCQQSTSRL